MIDTFCAFFSNIDFLSLKTLSRKASSIVSILFINIFIFDFGDKSNKAFVQLYLLKNKI